MKRGSPIGLMGIGLGIAGALALFWMLTGDQGYLGGAVFFAVLTLVAKLTEN